MNCSRDSVMSDQTSLYSVGVGQLKTHRVGDLDYSKTRQSEPCIAGHRRCCSDDVADVAQRHHLDLLHSGVTAAPSPPGADLSNAC